MGGRLEIGRLRVAEKLWVYSRSHSYSLVASGVCTQVELCRITRRQISPQLTSVINVFLCCPTFHSTIIAPVESELRLLILNYGSHWARTSSQLGDMFAVGMTTIVLTIATPTKICKFQNCTSPNYEKKKKLIRQWSTFSHYSIPTLFGKEKWKLILWTVFIFVTKMLLNVSTEINLCSRILSKLNKGLVSVCWRKILIGFFSKGR